jgi:hypothetical protein
MGTPAQVSCKSTEDIHGCFIRESSNAFNPRLFFPYSKVHASVTIVISTKDFTRCNHGYPTMLHNPSPLLSKTQLTDLNLNHFKMV